jgi:transposase
MAWRKLTTPPGEAIRVHLPRVQGSPRGGRARGEERRGGEGIRWVLWPGAPGRARPRRYGSPATCGRRLTPWAETGGLRQRWRACWAPRTERQQSRGEEGVAAGRVMPATPGAPTAARRSAGRGPRGWWWSLARALRGEQALGAASPAGGSWCREPPAAGSPGAAGYGAEEPRPAPPSACRPSRGAPAAAVSAAVARRADVGLVGALSAPRRALRMVDHDRCRLLPSRLCPPHLTEGFEMTSSPAKDSGLSLPTSPATSRAILVLQALPMTLVRMNMADLLVPDAQKE